MIFTIIYLFVCLVAGNVWFDANIFLITCAIDLFAAFIGVLDKDGFKLW